MAETERSLPPTPMQYFLPGQNLQLSPSASSVDEIKEPLSKRIKIDEQNILPNQNNTSLLSSSTSSSSSSTTVAATSSNISEGNRLDFKLENFFTVNINGAAQCKTSNCENPVPLNTVKNENPVVGKGEGELHDFTNLIAISKEATINAEIKINQKIAVDVSNVEVSEPKTDELQVKGKDISVTKDKVKKKKLVNKGKGKAKVKCKRSDDAEHGDESVSKKKVKKKKKKKKKVSGSKAPEVPNDDNDDEESETGSTDDPSTKTNTSSNKKKKNRAAHLRKNIRDIMSANQLEEETLAAQREEAERRQRMNLKLQQQQQQQQLQLQQLNLPHVLQNSTHSTPFKEEVDLLCTPENDAITGNFLAELAGPLAPPQHYQSAPKPSKSIIDEVTLSSDDEEPKAIVDPPLSKLKSSLTDFHPLQEKNVGPFRSSGGIMTKNEVNDDDNVISLTSPDDQHARDSDSSDDCVVISPRSYHDEVEKEGREDETNVPDELGRVLVNVAHPPEDDDIFLAPQIARAVKPHQIGGIRFLYDNVVESLDRFETSNGFGCILAHSMGLGKTIQAVSFCDIFLRYTRATKVLIIVPINTIQNWVNEFNFWIPSEDSVVDHATLLHPTKVPPSLSGIDKKPTKRKSKPDQDPGKQSNSNNDEESPQEQMSQSCISSHMSTSSSCGSSPPSPLSSPFLHPTAELQQQQISPEKEDEKAEPYLSTPSSTSLPVFGAQGNICNNTMGVHMNSSNNNDPEKIAEVRPRSFQLFILNETVKTLTAREKIIGEWSSKGGVLLLGYEMYRMLALKRLKRSSKKKSVALDDLAMKNRMIEQMSLDHIYSCIVNPGPDLVLCDEGHRIKNSGASISQALKAVRTKRRVVLTGYPLQNNLMEYWCMVDFVRPNYLGSKVEFANMFERPITNGQCVDSSNSDKKLMRYRSHVLHTLLEGFVQRRSHVVLQSALPFKEEWVFFLKMTTIQYALYKEFIRYLKEERQEKEREKNGSSEAPPSTNPIKAFSIACKIWNHPDALYNVVKKKVDLLDDLDLDDIVTEEQSRKVRGGRKPKSKDNSAPSKGAIQACSSPCTTNLTDFSNFNTDLLGLSVAAMANIPATVAQAQNNQSHNQSSFSSSNLLSNNSNSNQSTSTASDGRSISLDWAIPIFKNYASEVLENGVKFQLLFIIIEEVLTVGDKLLVFSQSLLTLDLIELFLGRKFNWKKNKEYFRLDGSTSGLDREKLIYEFNDKEGIHLFLVSTRAGSLGINLIGANRVIVFDASWNPCHDAQAVCRVYRYGQKKECQIYRFVTDCSLEKRIYDRQINKRGMSDRVVDEMNPETLLNSRDVSSFLVLDHEQMDALQAIKHNFNMDKFADPVLKNVLNRCADRFTREPFEHESLLIDRKETKLSANEKRIAHRNYLIEKNQTGSSNGSSYNRPSYAAYYQQQQQQQQDSQSLGVPIHPSFSNVGMTTSSSMGYNSYNMDNRNLSSSYIDHHHSKSGGRPFQEQMMELRKIQQQRLQMQQQYQTQRQRNLNFPFQALKDRGIDVQSMLVKKDAYMKDPGGGPEGSSGPEIYLRAGEKIHIFRSKQGIYFRVPNGRIISIKQINSSLLPKGLSLSDNLTEEQIQSIVFSLLRPAGKIPPPYFNSCLNSNGPKPEIPPFFGSGSGSSSSLSSLNLFKTNRPPPSLQKLPPTLGIGLPSYQNHQITNFRSNSGGDVTIWRKHSDQNKNQGKSGVVGSTTPTNYHNQIMAKNQQGVGMNNTTSGSSSGRKDSDVEVIEFNTHFGELLNPRMDDLKISSSASSSCLNALLNQTPPTDHSRRRKDQLSSKTYSDSPLNSILQDNSNSNTSAEVQFNSQSQTRNRNSGSIDAPDISITTIAPAPGGQQNNNYPSLSLGSLLSGTIDNNGTSSQRGVSGARPSFANSPFKSLAGTSSENHRNLSCNNLLWDQNSGCGSASNSGSDHNSSNSNNCPDEDNLEDLFWSLTGEQPGSSKSKLPGLPGMPGSIVTNAISNHLTSDLNGIMNDENLVSSSWNTMTPESSAQQHQQQNYRQNNLLGGAGSSSLPSFGQQQGTGRYDFDPDLLVQNMLRGISSSSGVGAGSPRGISSGFSSPASINNQNVSSGGGLRKDSSGDYPFSLSNSSPEIDVFGNVFENAVASASSSETSPPTASGITQGNYDDFLEAAQQLPSRISSSLFGGIARTNQQQQRPVNISHPQHLQNMLNTGQYYNSNLNHSGENIGHGTNRMSHNFPTNLCNFNLNNN